MSKERVVSERGRPIAAVVMGLFGVVAFSFLAVEFAVRPEPPDGLPREVVVAFMAVIVVAVAYLYLWRGVRMGAVLRPDVLEVRGLLRSRHLPWQDIQRFDFDGFGIARVVLRDGTAVRLTGITSPSAYGANDLGAQRLLAELDAELAKHRHADLPDEAPSSKVR